jgi:Fur family transcriptional regulator, peroxide stress response regulator
VEIAKSEIERRLEHFKDVARGAGVKFTHQRLEIFRAVASSVEHPSAEAVYRAVRSSMPTVSMDTVYRTLWLLTDLGLLNILGQRQDSVRFDANLAQHHHYRCVTCGMVRDFESTELDDLPIPDAVNRFGDIARVQVDVQGVCAECKKNADEGHAFAGIDTDGEIDPPSIDRGCARLSPRGDCSD